MDLKTRINNLRHTRSVAKTFALILFGLFIQFYLFRFLPFFVWDLPGELPVYVARLISFASSLLLIWAFAPSALSRFKINITFENCGYFALALVAVVAISIIQHGNNGANILDWANAILFSLMIGLDEEAFGRGFTYAIIEKHGQELALLFSALIFGLSHITNYLYGYDSFDYALGHMLGATCFGYLMAAIMVNSGNIWPPIFIHGLADVRWIVMDPEVSSQITGGHTNWLLTLIICAAYIIPARSLIGSKYKSNGDLSFLKSTARKFGLIE